MLRQESLPQPTPSPRPFATAVTRPYPGHIRAVGLDFDGTLTQAKSVFEPLAKTVAETLVKEGHSPELAGYANLDAKITAAEPPLIESKETLSFLCKTFPDVEKKAIGEAMIAHWGERGAEPAQGMQAFFDALQGWKTHAFVISDTPIECLKRIWDVPHSPFADALKIEHVHSLCREGAWLESTQSLRLGPNLKKPGIAGFIRTLAEEAITKKEDGTLLMPESGPVFYLGDHMHKDAISAFRVGMIPIIIEPKELEGKLPENAQYMLRIGGASYTQQTDDDTFGIRLTLDKDAQGKDMKWRDAARPGTAGEAAGFPYIAVPNLEGAQRFLKDYRENCREAFLRAARNNGPIWRSRDPLEKLQSAYPVLKDEFRIEQQRAL